MMLCKSLKNLAFRSRLVLCLTKLVILIKHSVNKEFAKKVLKYLEDGRLLKFAMFDYKAVNILDATEFFINTTLSEKDDAIFSVVNGTEVTFVHGDIRAHFDFPVQKGNNPDYSRHASLAIPDPMPAHIPILVPIQASASTLEPEDSSSNVPLAKADWSISSRPTVNDAKKGEGHGGIVEDLSAPSPSSRVIQSYSAKKTKKAPSKQQYTIIAEGNMNQKISEEKARVEQVERENKKRLEVATEHAQEIKGKINSLKKIHLLESVDVI
nr:uncharacterized protein LOC109167327 [Ipomoea batatas]